MLTIMQIIDKETIFTSSNYKIIRAYNTFFELKSQYIFVHGKNVRWLSKYLVTVAFSTFKWEKKKILEMIALKYVTKPNNFGLTETSISLV